LETPQIGVVYFYFDFKDEGQTAEFVVTSLLKQLIYQFMKIPTSLELAYDKWQRGQRKIRPDESAFAELFTECAKEFSTVYESPVFIVLDAYDESPKMERKKLISYLQQFHQSGASIYLTTRPELLDNLQKAFAPLIVLEIKARDIDIELYVRDRPIEQN
jgi:hypothetical protein